MLTPLAAIDPGLQALLPQLEEPAPERLGGGGAEVKGAGRRERGGVLFWQAPDAALMTSTANSMSRHPSTSDWIKQCRP